MVWLETLCEDLGHLTDAELDDGCRRYRQNPENRWFPSPGHLLQACRNPYELGKPRRYAAMENLPPPRSPEEARALIEATRRRHGWKSKVPPEDRPPLPQESGPMDPERKARLMKIGERGKE